MCTEEQAGKARSRVSAELIWVQVQRLHAAHNASESSSVRAELEDTRREALEPTGIASQSTARGCDGRIHRRIDGTGTPSDR